MRRWTSCGTRRCRRIKGNGLVDTLVLNDVKQGSQSERNVDGVFIYVGLTPNTQYLRGRAACG